MLVIRWNPSRYMSSLRLLLPQPDNTHLFFLFKAVKLEDTFLILPYYPILGFDRWDKLPCEWGPGRPSSFYTTQTTLPYRNARSNKPTKSNHHFSQANPTSWPVVVVVVVLRNVINVCALSRQRVTSSQQGHDILDRVKRGGYIDR